MPRVETIEKDIARVEGFNVDFCHADGRNVRADKDGLPSYPYQKAGRNEIRVAQWREQRFRPNYPDYGVRVLLGDGTEAHGVTKLVTVRESYQDQPVSPPQTQTPEEDESGDNISSVGDEVEGTGTAVWVVRAGSWGDEEPTALDNNVATIHWNELPDLTGVSRDDLENLYREAHPDDSNPQVGMAVRQVWAFRGAHPNDSHHEIKKGDLVILPLVRMWHALAIGEVTGPYKYRTDLGSEVLHTIPVDWFIADLPRSRLDPDLSKALGLPPTVYRIKSPPDAEQRLRAILCDEIDRRHRRVLRNYPPIQANIIHSSGSHPVRLYALPRAGELVQLCPKGSTEPRCFKVDFITHDVGDAGKGRAVEIHVSESMALVAVSPPLSPKPPRESTQDIPYLAQVDE